MFALAAHADEREAHVREVEQYGADLPEGSYGRRNRQAIRRPRNPRYHPAARRPAHLPHGNRRRRRVRATGVHANPLSPEHPADREIELD